IRSGSSSLVTLPSLFLSNAMIRSTISSTLIRAGPTRLRAGPCFWPGGCAPAAATRTSAAGSADARHSLPLRMPGLLCGQEERSSERVGELRVREELPVGQRLQEGDEGGLLGVREPERVHPGVEVGVRFTPGAVV